METIRENPKRIAELAVSEEYTELEAGDGVCFELKLKIDLERTNADELELDLRCGAERKTICLFHFKKGEMCVDRNAADGWSKGVSRSVLYLQGKKNWMCIYYLIRVPLKFLQTSIRIIIPTTFSQKLRRIS